MKKYIVVTLILSLSLFLVGYLFKLYFIDGLPSRHKHVKQFASACFKQYEPFDGLTYELTTTHNYIKGGYDVIVYFSDEPNTRYDFYYNGNFKNRNEIGFSGSINGKRYLDFMFMENCEIKK